MGVLRTWVHSVIIVAFFKCIVIYIAISIAINIINNVSSKLLKNSTRNKMQRGSRCNKDQDATRIKMQ